MMDAINKVITIALSEVGYIEKKSNSQLYDKTANAGYNNYTKYAYEFDTKYPTFYNTKKNGAAYCDIFVDWVFVKAFGEAKAKELLYQPSKSLGAGCTYSARYYKNNGRFFASPKVGDQIFFGVVGKEKHTGIVYKVDNIKVYTIEGNTREESGVIPNGGGVYKKEYRLNDQEIVGYGRPKYEAVEQPSVKPSTSTSAATSSPRSYLMKGDKGNKVKEMQKNLIKLGYSCGSYGADGNFGSGTELAVKNFQKANGLVVDGKYGKASKAKAEELLKQMEAKPINKTDTIKEVQNWMNTKYKSNIVEDGLYGVKTKKALVKILQTELNQTYGSKLVVDGIWGAKTRAACKTLKVGINNDVVAVLQAFLICNKIDGVCVNGKYDNATADAVGKYQSKNALTVDKMAGKNTFAKLCG